MTVRAVFEYLLGGILRLVTLKSAVPNIEFGGQIAELLT